MATIMHGKVDVAVQSIVDALNDYERQFPGSRADVYRQNPGSIYVRIIDDRFDGINRSRRHDEVWDFLDKRVGEDAMSEVAVLILLPNSELKSSLANMDFEDPIPAHF